MSCSVGEVGVKLSLIRIFGFLERFILADTVITVLFFRSNVILESPEKEFSGRVRKPIE
jgi:hypothetical protein